MENQLVRPFTAASFNQYLSEKKLMAAHCTSCNSLFLPPRTICPKCHAETMEWVETSGKATLAAFTSIYIGPTFMVEQGFSRENPYLVGIVELEEGVRISARITGLDPKAPQSVKIGVPLSADFVEHGEGEAKKISLAFRG